jgi:DNA-binding MurR/RpiR family transcriptional regulator
MPNPRQVRDRDDRYAEYVRLRLERRRITDAARQVGVSESTATRYERSFQAAHHPAPPSRRPYDFYPR